MTEEKENCNFQQNYNVFGLDDKPCCYLYHKYCDEIDSCYFKRCKRLEQQNKELKTCIEMIENTEGQAHIEGVRLAKENKELLKYETYYLDKYIELRNSLEEIREVLQKPDLPPSDEDNLMTPTELLIVVDANRNTKLMNIQDKINEVLDE